MPKPESTSANRFANSASARVALMVVRACGLALLCYWGWHLYTQLPYWDDFRREAAHDGNPLLTPACRVTIDVLAMIAGALMLKKSKWALVPYALHFVAYLCFVLSITGYAFDMRMLPRVALMIAVSQICTLGLLLWLEAKKALSVWPLRDPVKQSRTPH